MAPGRSVTKSDVSKTQSIGSLSPGGDERMRKAGEVFDDERLTRAQQVLGEIELDPVTVRRRLLAAPEGVDALIVRLRALRAKTESTRHIAWDDEEGKELDQILGNRPGQVPLSRAALLTRGIAFDHWLGLDPAEFAELEFEPRLSWAVGEVQKIIDAEIRSLQEHQAGLDTTRRDQDRAEAAERQLLDVSKDGIAIRRYAGAAERAMLKMLQELRLARAEAQERAIAATLKTEVARPKTIEIIAKKQVEEELGSFCNEPRDRSRSGSRSVIESIGADAGVSFAPVTIGRAPTRPGPAAS